MVRSVRFIREWHGKLGQNDKRDIDMTFGQRELLVMRGFAEWVDGPVENPPEPQHFREGHSPRKQKPQRESAATQ